jgi:hypothetical protein
MMKLINHRYEPESVEYHPCGDGYAEEHFAAMFEGTVDLGDVDTEDWGDDLPDRLGTSIREFIYEEIHEMDKTTARDLNLECSRGNASE